MSLSLRSHRLMEGLGYIKETQGRVGIHIGNIRKIPPK
jgi:hypothetical protein